jgi:hypothetical protein
MNAPVAFPIIGLLFIEFAFQARFTLPMAGCKGKSSGIFGWGAPTGSAPYGWVLGAFDVSLTHYRQGGVSARLLAVWSLLNEG